MRNKVVNGTQEVTVFVNDIELDVRKTTIKANRTDKCTACLSLGCQRRQRKNKDDLIQNLFEGRMDEFLVYSRALSNNEIKGHYEMGNVHAN